MSGWKFHSDTALLIQRGSILSVGLFVFISNDYQKATYKDRYL